MKQKQLSPIKVPPKLDEELDKEITLFFFQALFEPITKQMEESQKIYFNATTSAIDSAIKSGQIQFSQGIFKGSFNAKIAKEFKALGIKFDKRIKGYRSLITSLPIPTQIAIAQTASAYQKLASSMISTIDNLNYDGLLGGLNLTSSYNKAITSIDSGFDSTVGNILGVKVELTPGQREVITTEFSENLKVFIKDFADEEVLILRKRVEKEVFAGIRAESLQNLIKDRFQVSENKAKFLAKQEISLFTSKYKQAKYQEVGINKYKWSISNVRTRPSHRALNGKIFSYDDPPITNPETGETNNPGEDFGCNCVAIPILEL